MKARGWIGLILLALVAVDAGAETRLAMFFDRPSGYLGEPRQLVIELRTDRWFRQAVSLPQLSIAGAVVLDLQGSSHSYTERQSGTTWAVIRRELLVIPQRLGKLLTPSLSLEVWEGRAQKALALEAPSIGLEVEPLPQMTDSRLAVGTALRLSEQVSQTESEVAQGDGISRQIKIELAGNVGMFIEPLSMSLPEGVRLYADRPKVQDHSQRGQLLGQRIETFTYLFEQPGEVVLPPIRVWWWNLTRQRLELAQLPERRIQVRPLAEPSDAEVSPMAWWWLLVPMLLVGLVLLKGLNAEQRCFVALLRAARCDDAAVRVRVLYVWMDRLHGRPLPLRAALRDDASLAEEAGSVLAPLYRHTPKTAVCRTLSSWRWCCWRRRKLAAATTSAPGLPPLNGRSDPAPGAEPRRTS
ncbi:BatD family protein [Motiliproteus coralliicola]|nr:BatD family protein [Motiliproteus coralliicola]